MQRLGLVARIDRELPKLVELGLGLMLEPQGARAASVVLVCSFFLWA